MKPKNLLITGLNVMVIISNISTFSFAQGPWTKKLILPEVQDTMQLVFR